MSLKHELLVDLLREVNRGLGKNIRYILVKHMISPATMIVMKQLELNQGITISGLARLTGIAKSHISHIVDDLVRQGWVEKRTDPADQRVLRIFPTEAAAAQLEIIHADIRQFLSKLVSGIPETRKVQIIEGLQDIQAALKRVGEE